MTTVQIIVTAIVTVLCCLITNLPAWWYARAGLKQGKANGTAAGVASANAEIAADLAKETSAKSDVLIASTATIHELVNSGSDKLKAEIVKLQEAVAIANARADHLAETIERLLAAAAAAHLVPGTPS